MHTLLLGEAPKGDNGYAFDWEAWTTVALAEALSIRPQSIRKFFWVDNVFRQPVETQASGHDEFDHFLAVEQIRSRNFSSQRIICVGKRVAKAFSEAWGILQPLPLNSFCDVGGVLVGRIHHPASDSGRNSYSHGGNALPNTTIDFLINTIQLQYPDAFTWRQGGEHDY